MKDIDGDDDDDGDVTNAKINSKKTTINKTGTFEQLYNILKPMLTLRRVVGDVKREKEHC